MALRLFVSTPPTSSRRSGSLQQGSDLGARGVLRRAWLRPRRRPEPHAAERHRHQRQGDDRGHVLLDRPRGGAHRTAGPPVEGQDPDHKPHGGPSTSVREMVIPAEESSPSARDVGSSEAAPSGPPRHDRAPGARVPDRQGRALRGAVHDRGGRGHAAQTARRRADVFTDASAATTVSTAARTATMG